MTDGRRLGVGPARPMGHIPVENVTYTVEGMDRPILSTVSFEVAAGEIVGGIGPSGAGKTTLATLMVGIEAPTHGHVRLDGTDVYAWPSEDLGRYLGYLPQSVELFDRTVRDNIGRLQADAPAEATLRPAPPHGPHPTTTRLTPKTTPPTGPP